MAKHLFTAKLECFDDANLVAVNVEGYENDEYEKSLTLCLVNVKQDFCDQRRLNSSLRASAPSPC